MNDERTKERIVARSLIGITFMFSGGVAMYLNNLGSNRGFAYIGLGLFSLIVFFIGFERWASAVKIATIGEEKKESEK